MRPWYRDHIVALVLAAGRGARMGAPSKLLLPHPADGAPLLRHSVQAALALQPFETLVVVPPEAPDLAAALAGLRVRLVPNPDYAEGMGTSIRAGVAALRPETRGLLVLLGDSPDVPPAVFAALRAAFNESRRPITVPVYGSVAGPPTLFTRLTFPDLLDLSGDQGGRQVIRAHPDWVTRVSLPASWLPTDIDTPEDYAAFGGRPD